MDTLFFLISIIGMVVITFWAYRNDRRADIAEQDGVLAIKQSGPAPDRNEPPSPAPVNEPPSLAGRPPRRRFVTE